MIRPDSRNRARTRTGIGASRCITPCYRHPDELVTGICASCLRERLSIVDVAATPNVASPELRRCRSVVSISKRQVSSIGLNEPRRKSCDVVSGRSSLFNLFNVDDLKNGSESEAKVELNNVGLPKLTYTAIESINEDHDEIRASSNKFGQLNADAVDSEAECKTMKEYIDLEFQKKVKNKSKDLKGLAGNFFGAASVFTRKLRNWRLNNKIKNHKNCRTCRSTVDNDENRKSFHDAGDSHRNSEITGRRSCDAGPRFSFDSGQISFNEPRSSWDGYMIARTIPRLAPIFSVVENGILRSPNKFENRRLSVDGPMQSILQDESSSGASNSAHSILDSSSSVDWSSSVRSSGKKTLCLDDQAVCSANAEESEDVHSSDGPEKFGYVARNVGNLARKSIRWHKVCNVFGFRHVGSDNDVTELNIKLERNTSTELDDRMTPHDDECC